MFRWKFENCIIPRHTDKSIRLLSQYTSIFRFLYILSMNAHACFLLVYILRATQTPQSFKLFMLDYVTGK